MVVTALAVTAAVLAVAFAWSLGFHLGRAHQARLTRDAYARITAVAQTSIRGFEGREK